MLDIRPSPIDLPTGTIEHRVAGPLGGRPIVFVHGALVDSRLWDGTAAHLTDAGHRVHLPDLPLGSHRVPMPETTDLTPRGQARIVLDYVAALDLDDVTIVANDTGGAITQLLLDIDATRVGRVVLTNCDTFDRFPPPPFDIMFKLARSPRGAALLLGPTRLGPIRSFLYGLLTQRTADPDLTRSWLEPILRDARVRDDFARLVRGVDPSELVDAATRLDRFEGQVLFAWAPADRFFRIADARRLGRCFADGHARTVEIDDAKTFVALDQPARLAEAISTFLAETTPRPAPASEPA